MLWDILLVGLGLGVLLLAGDALVKGAVNLSLRLGVPALIVGLTVVAFGTSAPELLVAVQAVLAGAPALALGNVVGSNTANILLVLGVPALIAAVPVARNLARDYAGMMAATALFVGLALLGPIGWPQALILLAGLALMLGDAFLRARAHRAANGAANGAADGAADEPGSGAADPEAAELEGAEPDMPGWRIGLYTVLGIIGLPLGAELLVDGSVSIAVALGVSEAVIGLTLVAIGTSLPELATTVMAAIRREAGVALGNVLGSNMFNLLAIIGVAGLFGTIPIPAEMLVRDLWVMVGASALLGWFVLTGRSIGRVWGVVLLLLYAAYLAVLALYGGVT